MLRCQSFQTWCPPCRLHLLVILLALEWCRKKIPQLLLSPKPPALALAFGLSQFHHHGRQLSHLQRPPPRHQQGPQMREGWRILDLSRRKIRRSQTWKFPVWTSCCIPVWEAVLILLPTESSLAMCEKRWGEVVPVRKDLSHSYLRAVIETAQEITVIAFWFGSWVRYLQKSLFIGFLWPLRVRLTRCDETIKITLLHCLVSSLGIAYHWIICQNASSHQFLPFHLWNSSKSPVKYAVLSS